VDDSTAVEQFRALGNPARWAIVSELREGPRCACVLAELAGVSPTLLSHHVRVLCSAGLITGVKRGRWVDYSLDQAAVDLLGSRLLRTPAVGR